MKEWKDFKRYLSLEAYHTTLRVGPTDDLETFT